MRPADFFFAHPGIIGFFDLMRTASIPEANAKTLRAAIVGCMYAYMYACMYSCMCVCIYVRMYV